MRAQCNKPFDPAADVVPIYGEPAEVAALRERMERARAKEGGSSKRKAGEAAAADAVSAAAVASASAASAQAAKVARVTVNPELNAAAVVALAQQQVHKLGTASVLRSIAQPATDAATTHSNFNH
eukprot:Unigene12271_Nuclearia_a/m.37291 Unigene12271_Nuclearia_a/g.37291  ORF Unigene12271_Nuclearia_a/g.37291 Unigene12271_Nuclearia_a/m.37291 type:complete len:125 (+) Unigene12271_Nuclearia_a:69-443(+)